MKNSHGRFAWHELNTTDPDAAQSFYAQITPWKTEPMEEIPNYTLWMNGGAPIGGMLPLSDASTERGVPPHWLAYVHVYDLDACVRQATALGGSVLTAPKEVPNVGCWAVIADPEGVAIGIYEPANIDAMRDRSSPPGQFSWHELMTNDYKKAFDFYRPLFHWETTSEYNMERLGIYHMFGQKGEVLGGMFNRTADMPSPNWVSYIRVGDVKQAAESVTQAGGVVMNGPMVVPGGDWIAQCRDAQGATFALHAPTAS
jgi:predicted enzyme related to lactoylglutathione lyase